MAAPTPAVPSRPYLIRVADEPYGDVAEYELLAESEVHAEMRGAGLFKAEHPFSDTRRLRVAAKPRPRVPRAP